MQGRFLSGDLGRSSSLHSRQATSIQTAPLVSPPGIRRSSCRPTVVSKSKKKEELTDPAQIGAVGTAIARVKDFGGPISLGNYMMLPLEQYFVLDPNQIRFISGNRFRLTVPRLQFFNVWLEPDVEISVSTLSSPPRVVLQAENCRIRGSDLIEKMNLDQRFCLRFVTDLTWNSGHPEGAGSASSSSSSSVVSVSPVAPVAYGEIKARLQMDVWCEVIPPFNLMPRDVLQSSCDLVLNSVAGSLLPLFAKRLGDDYRKWATDPAYRLERASRKKPLA